MYQAKALKYTLNFKRPGGTSRGVLTSKDSYFILLTDPYNPDITGIGECGILKGLSIDDRTDYEEELGWVCMNINDVLQRDRHEIKQFPSIQFGLEMALKDLQSGGKKLFYPSDFTYGKDSISINGLIWMGDESYMLEQIESKIDSGFSCLKMKIGAIDFDTEIKILKEIRKQYSADQLELRVDANGAFSHKDAPEKLHQLHQLELHSIEQPIRQGQTDEMAELCRSSHLPIALDEELIGVLDVDDKIELLETILPAYIILKPSLVGGFEGSEEWIRLAEERKIGWWITSALESNIGLNAIAQWSYHLNKDLVHGLGTGQLYTNNIPSPLFIEQGALHFDPSVRWSLKPLYEMMER